MLNPCSNEWEHGGIVGDAVFERVICNWVDVVTCEKGEKARRVVASEAPGGLKASHRVESEPPVSQKLKSDPRVSRMLKSSLKGSRRYKSSLGRSRHPRVERWILQKAQIKPGKPHNSKSSPKTLRRLIPMLGGPM